MRVETRKRHRILTEFAAAVLILLLVLGQTVYAAGSPIREVHRVPAGNTMYCFFVQKNVVLTPGQIAAVGDDEELTKDILKRAGLYARESNCTDTDHPAISLEAWEKAGNTFELSDIDLIKIRQAAPVNGEPVKLHLDVRFTLKPDTSEGTEPEEGPGKEQDTKPDDQSEKDPAVEPGTEPGNEPGSEPGNEPGSEPGNEPGSEPGNEPGDESGDEHSTKPDNKLVNDPAAEPGEAPAGSSVPEPVGDSEAEPGNDPDGESGDESGSEPEEKVREVYSTFKKTSPELLFIVIATEEDAAEAEETCDGSAPSEPDPSEPAKPLEPSVPDFPEEGDIDMDDVDFPADAVAESEMLPEYRKIDMKEKKGKPLASTLLDGDPVSLEWIEPKKTIGKSDFEEFLEHFPGGAAGFGATLGIAAVAAGSAAVVMRRKRRNEE